MLSSFNIWLLEKRFSIILWITTILVQDTFSVWNSLSFRNYRSSVRFQPVSIGRKLPFNGDSMKMKAWKQSEELRTRRPLSAPRMSLTSVGIYEFNAKDLIGHGAFAVVYKGRLKSVSEPFPFLHSMPLTWEAFFYSWKWCKISQGGRVPSYL